MNDAGTFDYAMPSLGADMDEGRVIEWRVAPGDTVHRGDLIAVVETEKSDIDIEIWHDGIVEEFLVDVGQLVDVGTPIARLRTVGAGGDTAATRQDASAATVPIPTPTDAPTPTPPPCTHPHPCTRTLSRRSRAGLAARTSARSRAGHRSQRGERQRTRRRGDRGRRRSRGHRAGRRGSTGSDSSGTPCCNSSGTRSPAIS